LYLEYPELKTNDTSNIGLIKSKAIAEKKLYFESSVDIQLNNIQSILGKTKYSSFRKAASRNNLNQGITALFHGFSGTGKTEAVYQISKKTGRDIMMVDLSQTKSMWFGESEKQVQKIFDDYNRLLQTQPITPILFINEVDGLLSKRMDVSNSHTTQTLNTIQNIILQALENFDGILFATTNLAANLDMAFERRFLFKVDFPKPDWQIRKRIWMNKLPELNPKMAEALGKQFELTGGQIDNQVRQLVLQKVLNKNLDVCESLQLGCSKEKGFLTRKPIGF
jgi:SpoVK/Ycf46/Vps4 family AAA+-type ATPase